MAAMMSGGNHLYATAMPLCIVLHALRKLWCSRQFCSFSVITGKGKTKGVLSINFYFPLLLFWFPFFGNKVEGALSFRWSRAVRTSSENITWVSAVISRLPTSLLACQISTSYPGIKLVWWERLWNTQISKTRVKTCKASLLFLVLIYANSMKFMSSTKKTKDKKQNNFWVHFQRIACRPPVYVKCVTHNFY